MSFLNESGLTRYDGKLKNLLASTYSTSATYDVGDYCIHGGSLYKCTTAIAAAEAWTSGHWTKVNLGNEIDAAKEDLEKLKLDVADAYSASDSHAVGDYVVRNGILYRCTTAIGSGGETWNAAHWTVVNIGDELVAIKADIGILKEDLADAYSSSKTYAVGDYCLKDGVLYRCTSAISTAEAWTSGHWTAVQVGEELCALNGAINTIINDLGEVSGFHTLPASYGSTNPETFLTEALADVSEAGLYFARRDYGTGSTTGYFGNSSLNMLFFTGASKNYVSGIVFSDNAKQFISFRKYENTYEEFHYLDEISNLNGAINSVCLRAAVQTISANGTTSSIALTGLTADHVVGNWGMFSDSACTTPIPENSPTCDITITTAANAWSVTIENFTSTFYLRPTFVLKQN